MIWGSTCFVAVGRGAGLWAVSVVMGAAAGVRQATWSGWSAGQSQRVSGLKSEDENAQPKEMRQGWRVGSGLMDAFLVRLLVLGAPTVADKVQDANTGVGRRRRYSSRVQTRSIGRSNQTMLRRKINELLGGWFRERSGERERKNSSRERRRPEGTSGRAGLQSVQCCRGAVVLFAADGRWRKCSPPARGLPCAAPCGRRVPSRCTFAPFQVSTRYLATSPPAQPALQAIANRPPVSPPANLERRPVGPCSDRLPEAARLHPSSLAFVLHAGGRGRCGASAVEACL